MVPINLVTGVGLAVFAIGVFGVLFRKNLVIVLMAAELMLNGVNIVLAGFGRQMNTPAGSIFAMFAVMVAVAEAAVGFALILSYFRHRDTYDLDRMNDLKG